MLREWMRQVTGRGADEQAVANPHRTVSTVFRCVNIGAGALSNVPLILTDGENAIEKGPLFDLLRAPIRRPRMTTARLVQASASQALLHPVAYLMRDKQSKAEPRLPLNLLPVPPTYVRPDRDRANIFSLKGYKVNGVADMIPPEEMGQFSYAVDPDDPALGGLSPITAARADIEALAQAKRHNTATLRNSGSVGGLVTYEGDDDPFDDEDEEAMERQFAERYAGSLNAGKTAFMLGKFKYTPFSGMAAKDMQWLQGIGASVEFIASVFGVPMIFLNRFDSGAISRAGVLLQKRMLFENLVFPIGTAYEEMITELVARPYDKNLKIEFDWGSVEALQSDYTELLTQARELFALGVPLSAANELLGLGLPDGMKWADVGFLPAGLTPAQSLIDETTLAPDTDTEDSRGTIAPNFASSRRFTPVAGLRRRRPAPLRVAVPEALTPSPSHTCPSCGESDREQSPLERARQALARAKEKLRAGANGTHAHVVCAEGDGAAVAPLVNSRSDAQWVAERTRLWRAQDSAVAPYRREMLAALRAYLQKARRRVMKAVDRDKRDLAELSKRARPIAGHRQHLDGFLRLALDQDLLSRATDAEVAELARRIEQADSLVRADEPEADKLAGEIAGLFDPDDYAGEAEDPFLRAVAAGGKLAVKDLDALGEEPEDAVEFQKDRIPKIAKKLWDARLGLVVDAGDKTKKAIRDQLIEGYANGENLSDLKDRVQAVFNASANRARTIARTETNTAQNGGRYSFFKENRKGRENEWLSARDPNVRDEHVDMDGERATVGEDFPNGLKFPGDPDGPAESVVNCRCTLRPITAFDAEDQSSESEAEAA